MQDRLQSACRVKSGKRERMLYFIRKPAELALITCVLLSAPALVFGSHPAVRGNTLQVTYLGNEGFMVRSGSKAVIFDALFHTDRFPEYQNVPADVEEKIETSRPPFAGIELALFSHVHVDHFDPQLAGQFLSSNSSAELIAPPEVLHPLQGSYWRFDSIRSRTHAVLPEWGRVTTLQVNGISVEAFRLRHGDTQNLAYVVNLDGRTVLHVGDADVLCQDFSALQSAGADVEVALIGYWFFLEQKTADVIRRLHPKHVIAMHLVVGESATASVQEMLQHFGGLAGMRRTMLANYPGLIIPEKPLDAWIF